MSIAQLKKILQDLNSTNEKLKILALMHTPRLSAKNDYSKQDVQKLHELIKAHLESPNPDIAFLSRKAFNFVRENLSLTTPIPDTLTLVTTKEPEKPDDHTIFLPNSSTDFSSEPFEICSQLDKIPASFTNKEMIIEFLKHDNARVQAAAIETMARISSIQDYQQLLTPFLQSDNNRVRANTIVALGIENFSLVAQNLAEMMNTTRISMRESAVFAISQLTPNDQLQNMLLKSLHDPYRDIRLRAIEILQKYPNTEVIQQMHRLSNDMDIEICEKSAQTLAHIENLLKITTKEPEDNSFVPFNDDYVLPDIPDTINDQKTNTSKFLPPDDNDYDEFIHHHDEFIEVSAMQESIAIESNFIEVNKSDLPAKENEIVDLFAIDEQKEMGTGHQETELQDLFAIDEQEEMGTGHQETELQDLFADEQEEMGEMGTGHQENELQDLFADEQKEMGTGHQEEMGTGHQENVGTGHQEKSQPDHKKEQLDKLIQIYTQKQSREKIIAKWDPEPFFIPLQIDTPDKNIFELFGQKPLDTFAKVWQSAAIIPKTQPDTAARNSQLQIDELLKEIGTTAFHILVEKKIANPTLQKIFLELGKKQKELRSFYQSKPVKNPQNDQKAKLLQKSVQDSFLLLGRTCMQEIRYQRFSLPEADSYQKRLQVLINGLNAQRQPRK